MSDSGAAETAAAPACHTDVCITCSDRAVPVRIVELKGDGLAIADTGVSLEEIQIELVEAGPGDVVLVHAGVAIGKVP